MHENSTITIGNNFDENTKTVLKRQNEFYYDEKNFIVEDPQPPHTTFFSHVSDSLMAVHSSTPAKESFSFNSHIHNEFEFIYILSGKGTYSIENKKYVLKEKQLILTPPLQYHCVQIDKGVDYDRVMIACPVSFFSKEAYDLYNKTDVIDCTNLPVIREIFKKIEYYQKHVEPSTFEMIVSNLLEEVFLNVYIENKNDVNNVGQYESFSPIVTQALAMINSDLFDLKSIKTICDKLSITEGYFFRLFKSETKISPKKYITNKRLMYAQSLLQLGEKPTSVCYKCGFDSYTAFYKRYVDFFGYPPSKKNAPKRETR